MFKELDYRQTSIGELTLRQRTDPRFGEEIIFEVKLGEEFLMSSLVTAGEIALANMALNRISGDALDIVIGGLGLGFTTAAALAFPSVNSVTIVEALAPVIDWHKRALVPLGSTISGDSRCQFHCADFFALALSDHGFASSEKRLHDVILLDIDHSPRHRLTDKGRVDDETRATMPPEEDFYHATNLRKMAKHLKAGGLFAMWSNDPPDDVFLASLNCVFSDVEARISEFPNPYSTETSSNTIYLASN